MGSINDILADRPTEEAKQQFCEISNHYCSIFEGQISKELSRYIPGASPENKVAIKILKIDRDFVVNEQKMSVLTGHSFEQLYLSKYVMSWYQAVAGNFSGGNPQAIRKGKILLDVNPLTGKMESDELYFKYLNFRQAANYIYDFHATINTLCKAGNAQ